MNAQTVNAPNAVENLNYTQEEDFQERMLDVPANGVITDATPISYILANGNEVKRFPKKPEYVIGNSTTSSKRKASTIEKTLPAEYIDNWDITSRPRKDGKRVDKYYYHKVEGFICRSVKEVIRFEKDGIRPETKRKTDEHNKEHINTENEINEMLHSEGNKEVSINEMLAVERDTQVVENRKVYVEEFLAKARYNLLHSFDP